MSVHCATLSPESPSPESPDGADVWAVLVSSLSARDDGAGDDVRDDLVVDTTVVDLVDHFPVIDDPRHQPWVVHPLAAVLLLRAAAVVAGMKGFTATAGWVTDTPPAMLAAVYTRCGKPPVVPSKGTIWQVVTRVDAAAVDAAVGLWLAARAGVEIAMDAPEESGPWGRRGLPAGAGRPRAGHRTPRRRPTRRGHSRAATGGPRGGRQAGP